MRRCLTCTMACLLWLPAAIACADPTSGKALLDGLRENREKLTSGIFRTSGLRETLNQEARRGSTVKFRAYCAFDGSVRRFRYEETFTDRYGPFDAAKTRSDAVKYVRTADRSIHVSTQHPLAIDIELPEAPVRGGTVSPFDPRVLGLVSDVELRSGMPRQSFARSFESVFEAYANDYDVEDVTQEAESVHRITFRFGPSHEFRKTLWIDAARGFTPVRMEVRRPKGGKLQAEPVVVTKTKWKEIAGVWVPVQSEMESHFNDDRMNVELTWEQVNKPVADEVFTIAGLGIPDTVPWKDPEDGTVFQVVPEIVDYRQIPPLVLRQQEFLEPDEVP
jgi:hypothetical protein